MTYTVSSGTLNLTQLLILISNKSFIKILFVSFHTMLTVERHGSDVCCDKFPVPQIDRKGK